MKTETLRARVMRVARHRRGGGTPDPWSKLTPAQMEEFAQSGDLPTGVSIQALFPPGSESVTARATSLFNSWTPATRDEFSRTGVLPAGIDPDVLAAVFARRSSDR